MADHSTAKSAIDHSLKNMGLEYIDLYLLHQAMKDYFSAWRAMEEAYEESKLKAIGVSNFYPHILTNFLRNGPNKTQWLTRLRCIRTLHRERRWRQCAITMFSRKHGRR